MGVSLVPAAPHITLASTVQILACGHWCAYWTHYPDHHPNKFGKKGYGPGNTVPCCLCRAEDYAKGCEDRADWNAYMVGKAICRACLTRFEAAGLTKETVTAEDFGRNWDDPKRRPMHPLISGRGQLG